MKLINKKDGTMREQRVDSALCGVRIDSVEFDKEDIKILLNLRPEHLTKALTMISMRFRPMPLKGDK